MSMEVVYRNPYYKVTDIVLVGNTEFVVTGWLNDGKGTDPKNKLNEQPDFEIDSIQILIPTTQQPVPINITQVLEDVNVITWIKDSGNDVFDYFRKKMIDKYVC